MRDQARQRGDSGHELLFAGVLLFSSPGCPHEEPNCLTPTEYVDVDLRPDVQLVPTCSHGAKCN
jgi:hypothetical protein